MFILLIVIIIIIFAILMIKQVAYQKAPVREINAIFTCQDEKTIITKFHLDTDVVDIILSDGREFTLPRAISASGARYANTDESIILWNKGDTAFITENDTTTYADCTEEK
ncbi:MAG: MliC family protein [Candidatus Woesearchaeota archaeon]